MSPGESSDLDPQGAFELLPDATQRLVRTVDRLDDKALAAPSGLPAWTRAHVVAHLALNAEGMAEVLHSRIEGRPTTMYRSDEARSGDIEELAAADRAERLRVALLGLAQQVVPQRRRAPQDVASARLEHAVQPQVGLRERRLAHGVLRPPAAGGWRTSTNRWS